MSDVATAEDVRERLAELAAGAWTWTAIGVAFELGVPERLREPTSAAALADATDLPVPLATSLAEALVAGGLARRTDGGFVAAPALVELTAGLPGRYARAETRAGLLQMAAFFDAATRGTPETGWTHADERILEAQGTMSAGAVDLLERHVLPQMTGLHERLDSGRGVLLDVGAGVGAVTIELLRRHPRLRAVALEPHESARRRAERNVAKAGLVLGSAGDDQRAVSARLRAGLWGGDTVEPERVAGWMEDAGLSDVVLMPRLPNGLVPMRARRPANG